ncbi:hypothetical protein MBT84_46220 [Streptomyces sp. MBT84]|nr:hypothetical protein [Streptomyces sp. MBT84]
MKSTLDAWLVFEDEAGFSMTPPTDRSWSRRGHTSLVRVRGRSRRRISVAALVCYKPGYVKSLADTLITSATQSAAACGNSSRN